MIGRAFGCMYARQQPSDTPAPACGAAGVHGAGANARVYDVSLERVARTVGQQFEAGSSVPIGDLVESF